MPGFSFIFEDESCSHQDDRHGRHQFRESLISSSGLPQILQVTCLWHRHGRHQFGESLIITVGLPHILRVL